MPSNKTFKNVSFKESPCRKDDGDNVGHGKAKGSIGQQEDGYGEVSEDGDGVVFEDIDCESVDTLLNTSLAAVG